MPKHTWSFGVKSDSGSGPVDSLVITGAAEINIGNSGTSTFQIGGNNDVNRWDGSITVANLLSFFMEADMDIQVRINSYTSPVAVFDITAKKALGWNNQNLPNAVTNPLAGITTITSIFILNKGTVAGVAKAGQIANFMAGFLLNQDVVYS